MSRFLTEEGLISVLEDRRHYGFLLFYFSNFFLLTRTKITNLNGVVEGLKE